MSTRKIEFELSAKSGIAKTVREELRLAKQAAANTRLEVPTGRGTGGGITTQQIAARREMVLEIQRTQMRKDRESRDAILARAREQGRELAQARTLRFKDSGFQGQLDMGGARTIPFQQTINRTAAYTPRQKMVRDIIAGTIRSMSENAARARQQDEKQAATREAHESLFGKKLRDTSGRTPAQQSDRDELALKHKRNRAWAEAKRATDADPDMGWSLSSYRGKTPNGSPLAAAGKRIQMFLGRSELAAANEVGQVLARSAATLRSGAEDYAKGLKKGGEVLEDTARTLPIIGGYVAAGRDIRGAIESWWSKDTIAEGAALAPGEEYANEAARDGRQAKYRRRAIYSDSREIRAQYGLALRSSDEAGERSRMPDGRRQRREMADAVTSAQLEAEKAKRDAKILLDQEIEALDKEGYDKTPTGTGGAASKQIWASIEGRKKEAQGKYQNSIEAAELGYEKVRGQFVAFDKNDQSARARQIEQSERAHMMAMRQIREENNIATLRKEGKFRQAMIREIELRAEGEKAAAEKEVKDLEKALGPKDERVASARSQLSETLAAIKSRSEIEKETALQQIGRGDRDRAQDRQEASEEARTDITSKRLRTWGHSDKADRLEQQRDYERELTAIRRKKMADDEAESSETREHADEAREAAQLARERYDAGVEALDRSSGPGGPVRGYAGSATPFGGGAVGNDLQFAREIGTKSLIAQERGAAAMEKAARTIENLERFLTTEFNK